MSIIHQAEGIVHPLKESPVDHQDLIIKSMSRNVVWTKLHTVHAQT